MFLEGVESRRQIQKQNAQTTNVSSATVHTSTRAAKRAQAAQTTDPEIVDVPVDTPLPDVPVDTIVTAPAPVADIPTSGGGLAAAIARSKIVKQEKEKTAREMQQSKPGVRKI